MCKYKLHIYVNNISSSSKHTSFCIICGTKVKGYPGGVDGDGELHQSPRPDDQNHHAQDFVGVHFVILQNAVGHVMQPFFLISKHLEWVKELDDVGSSADVAEEKLGKLISRHLALEWKVFWVGGL